MKVVIASGEYPPVVSGISRVASAVAAGLLAQGHEVRLITANSGLKRVGRVAVIDRMGKEILDNDVDILQIFGPTPIFTEQCVRYAHKRRIPIVYHLYSLPGLQTYYDTFLTRAIDRLYETTLLTTALKVIDCAIFTTRDLANSYTAYSGPYVVIPHAVPECKCPLVRFARVDSDQALAPVRIPSSLLFVGQLRPYKGVSYLLAAVSTIVALGHDSVKLTIAGDGPDRQKLESLTQKLGLGKSVQFVGRVSDEVLHSLYLTHELLVLPSVSAESFGLVLVEARKHGMKIVASDMPGVRELVRLLGGKIAPRRSPLGLADTVMDSLQAKDPIANAPPCPLSLLPGDEVLEYLRVYKRILSESHPS